MSKYRSAIKPLDLKRLPWISQKGNAPANDCGLACALMLVEAVIGDVAESVEFWSRRLDAEDDGTTPENLFKVLAYYGLVGRSGRASAFPYVYLVDYGRLPKQLRLDKRDGLTFWHWIVRTSPGTYSDPYHWTARDGADIQIAPSLLDAACANPNLSVWVESVSLQPALGARVIGPYSQVAMRAAGGKDAPVLAYVDRYTALNVARDQEGSPEGWTRVDAYMRADLLGAKGRQ